ncbi:sodium/glucose cotransporter [bacterium BMS3Abin05]|nr:sodium/glucose cotransporter [bacterium BMS3Abin05]GBE27716.1 sodium/glucose cotransporter [bacterium BMS3Bbin03]
MENRIYYWAGFLIYSLLVVVVGIVIYLRDRRKGRRYDNRAFWTADRRLSGYSIGLSISASMMSVSWSCVYDVQLFYWYGVGSIWLLAVPWLVTMGGFYAFVPLFRRLNVFSQPELLEKRFGKRARRLLAPTLILVFITWAGAEIFAAGILIAPFLGISLPWMLFLIALVVALYSFTGGFEAVVSTDKIQFAIVAVFIAATAAVGLKAALHQAGSFTNFWAGIPPAPKADANLAALFSPGMALIGMTFIAYLPGWLVETDVWVRFQAAATNREARKGIGVAALNSFVFVGILPLFIGLTALYLYPPVNAQIPDKLQDASLIFTVLLQEHAPTAISLVLSIGLIAAAMSTVDTCGNVVALSISYDILEPALKKKWPPKRLNRLARLVSVIAIGLAFVYALFTNSLWDIFYLSSGLLTTTIFIPVMGAFLKNTTRMQIYLSIILGFLGTLTGYFLESSHLLQVFEPNWLAATGLGYILFGFLLSAAGFWLGKMKTVQSPGSSGTRPPSVPFPLK